MQIWHRRNGTARNSSGISFVPFQNKNQVCLKISIMIFVKLKNCTVVGENSKNFYKKL